MTNELQLVDKGSAGGLVAVEQERAIQEVQAALILAKRFPRDVNVSYTRIIEACKRRTLANNAMYAYPKGKAVITGPSIRLAETMAQCWGNMQFGIRELSQRDGMSEIEAFAWDVETNTRQVKLFSVKHFRDTKQGGYALTGSRDIYELVANQGARRLRACILGVIPGDIVEAAVDQCEKTLKSDAEPIEDRVRKMLVKFKEMGVSQEMIEARLQHKLEAIIEAEIVTLRKIYQSMADGMSSREQWFDLHASDRAAAEQDLASMKKAPPAKKPPAEKPAAKKPAPTSPPETTNPPAGATGSAAHEEIVGEVEKPADNAFKGMNTIQLYKLLWRKLEGVGIKSNEGRSAVESYVVHNAEMAKTDIYTVLRTFLASDVSAAVIASKATAYMLSQNEGKSKVQEKAAEINKTTPPVKQPEVGEVPAWGPEHPLFPSKWKNMRAGDGTKTGFGAHLRKYNHLIKDLPDDACAALDEKWRKVYKGQTNPWGPMIDKRRAELLDQAASEAQGETISGQDDQEHAGGGDLDEQIMRDEIAGYYNDDRAMFDFVRNELGIEADVPSLMTAGEISRMIDRLQDKW